MKVGRPRNVETPEDMLELFERYRDAIKSNPKTKKIKGNKNFTLSEEDLERPLTFSGFEVFCFEEGVGTIEHYFNNTGNNYDEFCAICSHIKKAIRADQIEGGMIGQYNPSITQRLNHLTENIRQEVNIEQPLFPDLNNQDSE